MPFLFYLAMATTEFDGDFFVLFVILVKLVLVKHSGPKLFYFK